MPIGSKIRHFQDPISSSWISHILHAIYISIHSSSSFCFEIMTFLKVKYFGGKVPPQLDLQVKVTPRIVTDSENRFPLSPLPPFLGCMLS